MKTFPLRFLLLGLIGLAPTVLPAAVVSATYHTAADVPVTAASIATGDTVSPALTLNPVR